MCTYPNSIDHCVRVLTQNSLMVRPIPRFHCTWALWKGSQGKNRAVFILGRSAQTSQDVLQLYNHLHWACPVHMVDHWLVHKLLWLDGAVQRVRVAFSTDFQHSAAVWHDEDCDVYADPVLGHRILGHEENVKVETAQVVKRCASISSSSKVRFFSVKRARTRMFNLFLRVSKWRHGCTT